MELIERTALLDHLQRLRNDYEAKIASTLGDERDRWTGARNGIDSAIVATELARPVFPAHQSQ